MSYIRAAALLTALTLLVAGCTNKEKPIELPIQNYDDLKNTTISHLDKAIAAVLTSAAGTGGGSPSSPAPTEARREVGPAPCPQADNAFHVTGYDVVPLPVGAHRKALQAIQSAWSKDGYTETKEASLDGGGAQLILRHDKDAFTVEWISSDDRTRLVITVTSPCVIAPDGQYPH